MSRDQLSSFNPNDFSQSHPSDLNAIFLQPIAPPEKFSARQQVLDRILEQICKQDLLGKSYVDQYLRYKYRRNCKSNTLKQTAVSLVQFLTFFRNSGSIQLEQLSREDIEAFVEALQDRGLKSSTVNCRLAVPGGLRPESGPLFRWNCGNCGYVWGSA